jgi:hypothetical protein
MVTYPPTVNLKGKVRTDVPCPFLPVQRAGVFAARFSRGLSDARFFAQIVREFGAR